MKFVVIMFICMVLAGIKRKRIIGCEEYVIDQQQSKCLKGVCAVEIVLGHIGLFIDSPYLFPFRKAGILVVGIFFFLSGYGLSIKLKTAPCSFTKYSVKKILSLVMTLFLSNMVYVFADVFMNHEKYTPYRILKAVLGIELVNYPSWYLYELICFYILFAVFGKYAPKQSVKALMIIITVGSVAGFFLGIDSPWYGSAFCFALGIFCNREESRLKEFFGTSYFRYYGNFAFLIIIMAAGMIGFFALGEESFWGDVLCRNIASTSFSFLLHLFLQKWEIKGNIYEWLSSLAMYIYLYHMLMINILKEINAVFKNNILYTVTVLASSVFVAQMIVIVKRCARKVFRYGGN